MIAHRFIHETIAASWPFIVAFVAAAMVWTLGGLTSSRSRRISATSRHLILSIALLAGPATALLAITPLAGLVRSMLLPAAPAPSIQVSGTDPIPITAASPVRQSEVGCLLILAWAAGAVAFALVRVRQWSAWNRVARRASHASDGELLAAFESAAGGMPARLALSGIATEPMVVGLFRPVILMPERYAQSLDAAELETVFAHELEHVRRRDNITAAIHELIAAIFWFDPLHWIARRRLLELRERACDQRVLDRGCPARAYAAALARSCQTAIETHAVACMSGFHLRERIDSIMNYPSERLHFISDRFVRFAALIGTAALLTSLAAFVPAPTLASTAARDSVEEPYVLEVKLHPTADNRVQVAAAVLSAEQARAAAGGTRQVLAAMNATTSIGMPVGMSTEGPGRTYHIKVSPDSHGAVATLEVRDGETVVFRTSRTVAMEPSSPPRIASDAQPITLHLKGADIHDVLRTFSQLTDRSITADPSVKGTVSIHVTETPWDVALQRVAASIGLTVETTGDAIRLVPAPPRSPEERARAEAGTTPMRVGGDVKAPQILARVEPIYTAEAKAARIAGIVIIEVNVDEKGVVRSTKILKGLPYGLDKSAEAAVKQWIFAPALLEGKPVPVVFNLTVNFRPE